MSIGERATAALRPANQNPFHPSQWGSTILWPFVGSSNGSFGEREGGHLLRIFYCAHQPLPRIVHIIWSYFGCSANEESTLLFLRTKTKTYIENCEMKQVIFPAVSVIIQIVTVMVILKWSWSASVEMAPGVCGSSIPVAAAALKSTSRPALATAPKSGYNPTYSSFVWPSVGTLYCCQTHLGPLRPQAFHPNRFPPNYCTTGVTPTGQPC